MENEQRRFTPEEEQVLRQVQADLPDSATPFADIAKEAGLPEEQVLELLGELKEKYIIRRFGATLRHQQAGYGSNSMVAWQVDEQDIERVGAYMAGRPEISHCYQRRTTPEWPYNLYTMVHGRSPEECIQVVRQLSEETGMDRYEILFSRKELKKTSMQYF